MRRLIAPFLALLAVSSPAWGLGSPALRQQTRQPPGWVQQGAAVDNDNIGCRYWVRGTGLVNPTSQFVLARASAETVTRASGSLWYAGSGQLPTDCYGNGLQVWDGRTNLVLQSQAIGTTPWAGSNGGVGLAGVATNNFALAPDGTTTATRLQLDLNGGTTTSDVSAWTQAGVTVTSGVSYTQSFYIKSNTVNTYTMQVLANNGSVLNTITVTPAQQRLSFAYTTTSTSNILRFRLQGGVGNSATADLLIWGVQIELGGFASPYIPTTTGSAARAADNVTLSGALATLLAASKGTLIAYSGSAQQSVASTLVDANGTVMLGKTVGNVATTAVGAALSTANTGTWTGTTKAGLAWDAAGGIIDLNNGTAATDATARTPAATFHLGSTSGSSAFHDGNIQRLPLFSTKLPAAQLGALLQ